MSRKEKLITKNYSGESELECVKFNYEWTVKNFAPLHPFHEVNILKSPKFPNATSGIQFQLEIGSNQNYLYIGLNTESILNPSATGIFNVQVLNFKKSEIFSLGSLKKMYITKFNNLNFSSDGTDLIFECSIIVMKDHVDKFEPTNKIAIADCRLSADLGALLTQNDRSDLTITSADGHKILAHKLILTARSQVFAAMFRHPTKENQESSLTIEDFDHEVIEEMLKFIYTGEVSKIRTMAKDLLAVAEKYELERLKGLCIEELQRNLCVSNAVEMFKLADVYNDANFKLIIIDFIRSNADDISKVPDWIDLSQEYKQELLNHLFETSILQKK